MQSTPEGMAAHAYAATAADSIGGAGGLEQEEVEIYRRFLFDDEATYSKCEDDEDYNEDDGEGEANEAGREGQQGEGGVSAGDKTDGNATSEELGQRPPSS